MSTELTDLDAISRQGRIVPHVDSNGDFNGYRIYGIRPRSMVHTLGIRNGDLLNSVDGNAMDSMEAALDAYQTLQDADQFTVEITRRGQRHTISYEVQ
jgi:general secretion pathway protein C